MAISGGHPEAGVVALGVAVRFAMNRAGARWTSIAACAVAISVGSASAERIGPPGGDYFVQPGDSVAIMFLLTESTTPMYGYSLDLDIVPDPAATGAVTVDVSLSNFFDTRNVISASGHSRSGLFSVIRPTSDGIFFSTNASMLVGITSVPGVNDVLAQAYVRVSPDALGDFSIRVGGASALATPQGRAIPYQASDVIIHVLPAPGSSLMLLGAGLVAARRRRGH
ncbi:MAG: hypothetical protein JSR77_14815 [Planctomycetes bacterium]|nr:hypothetical protein [Planctomycetota bacterium]